MTRNKLIPGEETAEEIEKWFLETYKETGKSTEEVQLLVLYKLHQIEERLKVVEYQTKTHWTN